MAFFRGLLATTLRVVESMEILPHGLRMTARFFDSGIFYKGHESLVFLSREGPARCDRQERTPRLAGPSLIVQYT